MFHSQDFLAQPCLAYARLALHQDDGAAARQAGEQGITKGRDFESPACKRKPPMTSHSFKLPRTASFL